MKKIISIVFLFLAVIDVSAQKVVSLHGTVKGVTSGIVYLQKFVDRYYPTLDSAEIKDGKFVFSTSIPLPEVYGLTLNKDVNPYIIFLDKGDIEVELDSAAEYTKTVVKGSPLQDLYLTYRKERTPIVEFLKGNPNSLVAVYALYRDYSYRMSSEDIKKNLALLNPGLLQTPYAEILQNLISTREAVSIGKPAPDFTVPGMDGTPVTLSKIIKGHKYLLLDFWASWCGPCRHENPNIVRAYRKFHDKGFDILSVSLDRNREAWITATKKDGLTWHHASELKYWNSSVATLYGIRSIPANVLIDADGTIIGRNLRGDDLQVTLEGLLK